MSQNVQEATARAVEACQRGSMEALEAALLEGVPPNATDADGCSLLHWAAINNRLEIISRLLDLGADPNVVGGLLVSSPLHWAARVGHSNSAALLVKAGAVANVRDTQGYAPIHLAVQTNQSTLVAYLLEKFEYCKDITDNSGMTPVMWAAYRTFGMFPIRLLVRAGANLNAQEHLSGNTALHIAAQERNYCSVRELLAGNADPLLRNKQQETPIDIAKNMRNHRIISMLEDALVARDSAPAKCISCNKFPMKKFSHSSGFFIPGLILALIALMFHLFHYMAVAAILVLAFITFQCIGKFDFHTASKSLVPIGICVAEPVCMVVTWIVFSNPGIIEPHENARIQFVKMLEHCERVNYYVSWILIIIARGFISASQFATFVCSLYLLHVWLFLRDCFLMHVAILYISEYSETIQISENLSTMDRIRHSRGHHYTPVNPESTDSLAEPAITFSARLRNIVDFCISSF
ncbi:unnamed protein product [Strongylus vulgaris]|uniref:Uncharacterized protein n=1 Tax=Strongylus vulgaris TaxID=40348 RepID=A0A3P7IWS1_STRVU|nr:unnamed protein product [Strongylus vulgaris]